MFSEIFMHAKAVIAGKHIYEYVWEMYVARWFSDFYGMALYSYVRNEWLFIGGFDGGRKYYMHKGLKDLWSQEWLAGFGGMDGRCGILILK